MYVYMYMCYIICAYLFAVVIFKQFQRCSNTTLLYTSFVKEVSPLEPVSRAGERGALHGTTGVKNHDALLVAGCVLAQ